MKTLRILIAAALLAPVAAFAEAVPGEAAPDFSLRDTRDTTHSLSEQAGKVVVLEWTNPDCPFVKKHYGPGNMQALQERYTGQGVVWYSICSSAPGKQGHYAPDAWHGILDGQKSRATALLLDPDGAVGRAYGAKTTPHLFVIAADGTVAYNGAIDDTVSTNPDDIPGARPLLAEALDAVLAGNPVAEPRTTPYGCSVKY